MVFFGKQTKKTEEDKQKILGIGGNGADDHIRGVTAVKCLLEVRKLKSFKEEENINYGR